jgi:hypothetical protein
MSIGTDDTFNEDDFMGLLQMAAEEDQANGWPGDEDNGDGLTDTEAYVAYGGVVGKHGPPTSHGSSQERAFRDLLGGR